MLSIEKQSWLPSSLTSDRNNYSWLGCWACVYFVRACSLVTPLLMQLCFCLLVSVPPDPPWGMHFKWSGKGETCLAVFEAGHLPHGRLCHELSTNPPPTQSGHVLMILPVHCQFLLLKKKKLQRTQHLSDTMFSAFAKLVFRKVLTAAPSPCACLWVRNKIEICWYKQR